MGRLPKNSIKAEEKNNVVRIGGIDYKIVRKKGLVADEDNYGDMTHRTATIYLDADLDPQVEDTTLFHEIFEAIDHQHEMKLPHHQIQTLSNAFCQIMRDNRGIFNYERR